MKQKKQLLDQLLGKPTALWEQFHTKTKIDRFSKKILDEQYWPKEWKKIYYKAYGRLEEISLPPPTHINNTTFEHVLKSRKSEREFSKKPLLNKDLSTLLYWSAGLKQVHKEKRFYPSAGARYPLEVYLLTQNCEIKKGLYHYYVRNHSLEKLLLLVKFDFKKYFNQDWILNAGALIVITAVFKRTIVKYGERGYRHILIEAGHLAQNLYLAAAAQNLNICAIGGYNDRKIEEFLDVGGLTESVIYVLAIGRH